MSVFDRLVLTLAAVATITACYPVTDVTQANPPSALTTSTPVLSALKQVSPLIGKWVTYWPTGGPSDFEDTKIELEIHPDHTYSYFTPSLQGYGFDIELTDDGTWQPALIDIPAKQRNGTWRIGKSSYWQSQVKEGGFWGAGYICITPEDEDENDRGGCEPYTLQGDNLITPAFYLPQLGDVVVRKIEWKKTK